MEEKDTPSFSFGGRIAPSFLSLSGIALALGGLLTLAINAGLTPLIQTDASFAATAASSIFLWRQGLSALVALLLIFGSIGLYLRQAENSGRLSTIAFVLAVVGSAVLLANEWNQVFLVHDLAQQAPDVLNALDGGEQFSFYNLGAILAFVVFTIGWIIFAISLLQTGVFARLGPSLVIAGFFAIPILGGILGVWGAIVGNGVLAAGWVLLGYELRTFAMS